jgi:hypothetical protein
MWICDAGVTIAYPAYPRNYPDINDSLGGMARST